MTDITSRTQAWHVLRQNVHNIARIPRRFHTLQMAEWVISRAPYLLGWIDPSCQTVYLCMYAVKVAPIVSGCIRRDIWLLLIKLLNASDHKVYYRLGWATRTQSISARTRPYSLSRMLDDTMRLSASVEKSLQMRFRLKRKADGLQDVLASVPYESNIHIACRRKRKGW